MYENEIKALQMAILMLKAKNLASKVGINLYRQVRTYDNTETSSKVTTIDIDEGQVRVKIK